MRTVKQLFDYVNKSLLGGSLTNVSDIVEHINNAQDIIAYRFRIEAPIADVTITNNEFDLPIDCVEIKKLVMDGKDLKIESIFGHNVVIQSSDSSISPFNTVVTVPVNGAAKLYYYKKPAFVDGSNVDQELDIDDKYFFVIGKYIASIYSLADDDSEKAIEFKTEFENDLSQISVTDLSNQPTTIKNYW